MAPGRLRELNRKRLGVSLMITTVCAIGKIEVKDKRTQKLKKTRTAWKGGGGSNRTIFANNNKTRGGVVGTWGGGVQPLQPPRQIRPWSNCKPIFLFAPLPRRKFYKKGTLVAKRVHVGKNVQQCRPPTSFWQIRHWIALQEELIFYDVSAAYFLEFSWVLLTAWTMDLPDAQKVGLAFLFKYYTVLHEDPGFLHRLIHSVMLLIMHSLDFWLSSPS